MKKLVILAAAALLLLCATWSATAERTEGKQNATTTTTSVDMAPGEATAVEDLPAEAYEEVRTKCGTLVKIIKPECYPVDDPRPYDDYLAMVHYVECGTMVIPETWPRQPTYGPDSKTDPLKTKLKDKKTN